MEVPSKLSMLVRSVVNDTGGLDFTGDRMDVIYPMKYFPTKTTSGFSVNPNTGTGSFLRPAQNFGGPAGGDMVLFNRGNPRPFYAIITSYTQSWSEREGKLKILFFQDEYWELVEEALIHMFRKGDIDKHYFYREVMKQFGITKGTEICSKEITTKLHQAIDAL